MWAQWGHRSSKVIPLTNSHLSRKRASTDQIHPVFCRRGFVAVSFDFTPRPFLCVGILAFPDPSHAQEPPRAPVPPTWWEATEGEGHAEQEGGSGVGMEKGHGRGGQPPVPPGTTNLIISGVLQININNLVTEGIWENLIKWTLCKLAALPRNHSWYNPRAGKGEQAEPLGALKGRGNFHPTAALLLGSSTR